jgi:hypothetical protein
LTYQSVKPRIILTGESVIRSVVAMQTKVAEMLGVEFPICAFSHCRDVPPVCCSVELLDKVADQ